MDYLMNSSDYEVGFTNVEEAKCYYSVDKNVLNDKYNADTEIEKKYNKELKDCKTLSDVANVYNYYSDIIFDDSRLFIKSY